MSKKQIKILLVVVQALLIGMQFLPVGLVQVPETGDRAALSVFGMIHRYAGLGFSNDALVYLIFSCLLPLLAVVLLFALRERRGFGAAACLSAFYLLAAACFFSAARRKMVDAVTMTGLHYLIVFLAAVSLVLAAGGYCLSAPHRGGDGD